MDYLQQSLKNTHLNNKDIKAMKYMINFDELSEDDLPVNASRTQKANETIFDDHNSF